MRWHLETSHSNLISCTSAGLRFRTLIHAWRSGDSLAREWADTLRDVPLEAFCWEMPPLTTEVLDEPFECVFVDSPALARATADPAPFREHFAAAERRHAQIAAFENLGRDAFLVAPCPRGPHDPYAHLAAFHRAAAPGQIDALWATVGEAMARRIGRAPTWVSTAGLGVYWLHVRLDSRPKYYRHRPYAAPDYWPLA